MASGVRLLVPALRSGSIDQRLGTEHIVLGLRAARASGTLLFGEEGQRRAEVVFEKGLVRKARSTLSAYLGGVLYELGRIDDVMLNTSLLQTAKTRQLHGVVLRAQGAVTEEGIEAGLCEQIERRLADIVSLPEGTPWAFHENEDRLASFGGNDWPVVDPIGGIWRGLRTNARPDLVKATLSRARDLFFVLSSAFMPEHFGFDGAELGLARSFVTPRRLVDSTERDERADRDISTTAANLRHLLVVSGALLAVDDVKAREKPSGSMPAVTASTTPSGTMKAVAPPPPLTPSGSMPRTFASAQQALECIRSLLTSEKYLHARANALAATEQFPDSAALRIELAWVESNGEGSDEHAFVEMQIARFDALAKEHQGTADVYYYRSLLYRRQGMASLACGDLRMALQFDEKHLAASRDLRLFNARRERGASVAEAIGITNAAVVGKRPAAAGTRGR